MAIQTLINGEALLQHREKINENFQELNENKLNKTGGIITGEVLLEKTGLGQIPTRETFINLLGTGVTSKYEAGLVDSTHFYITDGTGLIIDKETGLYKEISFSGNTNVLDLYLTKAVTYVLVNNTGVLVQQTTTPTSEQLRNNILVAIVGKTSGGIINFVRTVTLPIFDGLNAIMDLFQATGPLQNGTIRLGGLASLGVSLSAGKIFSLGGNMSNSVNDPNYVDIVSSAQKGVRYLYRKAGWLTPDDFLVETESNVLKPGFYDNGSGTLQATGNNNYTIQNFWISSTGFIYCQYGQNIYGSLALAKDALESEVRINWKYTEKLVPLAQIIIKGATTTTNNTTDCSIINKGRFGFIL